MSFADQAHWDQRYTTINTAPHPARVLIDNQHLLPDSGQVLDLACGLGGNALWLAERGLSVDAWDCSSVALDKLQRSVSQRGLNIATRVVDFDEEPLPEAAFDLIVVSGFLSRKFCPDICRALRQGGLLAYQTYTQEKVDTAPSGPRNPNYLLAPGELLKLFPTLAPCVYREERDLGDLQQGLRNYAYLLASLP